MENRSFNTFCGKVVIGKNKESQRARKEENIIATFSVGGLRYWQSIFTVLSNLPSLNCSAVREDHPSLQKPLSSSHCRTVHWAEKMLCCAYKCKEKKNKKKNPKVVEVGDDLNNSSKTTLHFPLIT